MTAPHKSAVLQQTLTATNRGSVERPGQSVYRKRQLKVCFERTLPIAVEIIIIIV